MIYNNIVERLNQLCKFIIIMVLCVNAERHNIISSFRLCKTYQIYSLRIEGYVDLHGLKTVPYRYILDCRLKAMRICTVLKL